MEVFDVKGNSRIREGKDCYKRDTYKQDVSCYKWDTTGRGEA